MILETERLLLREFTIDDADFILELVNTPQWLKYIGDKGVKTLNDAEKYLKEGPITSYRDNGFGLWLVQLKNTNIAIGMCGLVNRNTLDHIDIGFAMLPDYSKKGYGFEIASATLNYAKNSLNIDKVIAITDPNNIASIQLLNKLGLHFEKTLKLSDDDSVLVFAPALYTNDRKKINDITANFYAVFANIKVKKPNVDALQELFVSNGRLTNNTYDTSEVLDLKDFISSRKKILSDGALLDFSEGEIYHKTEVFNTIAHRFSFYQKSGKLNGTHFESKGMKTIQFIKENEEWKILSVAWSDEIIE
ncbi:GNAT family N-acetyltransferase [Aquimarina algicola]|uniref:GNAT family N-acetyltransferase n=1 Tax=Aquimarina algicola TaxID=2589995 RepID=A0A504JMU0_9FLAO|nr:GNAT family N-acetyltransferase [Aquimarina algicola]TPN89108.1 GNAT family N-acetyltransferase [Aquimarina algicola]